MQHQDRRPFLHPAEITLVTVVVGAALACASAPDSRPHDNLPPPLPAAKPPGSPPPKREAKVVESPEAVAARLGVEPGQLKWSPGRKSYAVATAPKESAENGTPYRLAVFGAAGEHRAEVAAARPGMVEELRFLGESRLVYRIAPPARSLGKRATRPRPTSKKKTPPVLTVLYVIQPLAPIAAPVVCEGHGFTFSRNGDHVAWVGGAPGREWLGADGEQVYPRAGVASIQGDPAWSSDGRSLALIEAGSRPKLVVLVEFDNPQGDSVWPLPPNAIDPTMRVFWAGAGRLVVGHEIARPVFATSFRRN
ncbi:MAG TPA: hypothetical protein VF524_05085 [Polyangia bacterium]